MEGVEFDDDADAIVVSVRPVAKARGRCGRCGRRSPRYDHGDGRRRWRALDLGTTKVFVEADAPRVRCRTHGVTVAAVPWARHGAGHTRDFDDLAAWLAVRTSKSAVMELLRVAWRTVGSIVTRVNADIDATVDRLDGLRRIGIDEISYKRGHRYLIVVVDHDSGRLVWAGPGRNDTALERVLRRARSRTRRAAHPRFGGYGRLDRPGRRPTRPERVAQRRSVPCRRLGDRRARHRTTPSLERSQRSPLHPRVGRPSPLARPATRNTSPRPATRSGRTPATSPAANATNSTGSPRPTRGCGAPTSSKKDCATCSRSKATKAKRALDRWTSWARRSRIPAFVQLQRRIATHRPAIDAALDTGLSQGLVESTNTKIRLLTRIAFGFHGHEPLIALAMLALGSHPPRLPGRNMTHGNNRRARYGAARPVGVSSVSAADGTVSR